MTPFSTIVLGVLILIVGVYGSGLSFAPNLTWKAPRLQMFSRVFYRFHMGLVRIAARKPVLFRDIVDGRRGISKRISKWIHEMMNSNELSDQQLSAREFWLAQMAAGVSLAIVGSISILIEGT